MWSAIALALGLAMDATAVSAARGLANHRPRELVVLPILFGGSQSAMAALGWLAGRGAGPYLVRWERWVGCGLLVAIGGKMLVEAWRDGARGDERASGPETIALYLGLAVATSIDAAAAGITLPLVPVAPPLALALIGAVTAACSAAGYLAGRIAGERFGAWLAMLGGLTLIGIGVRLLVRAP